MILVGNQRGGARDLARHLLNTHDNEHVEVHELSGFVSDTLTGALNEAYAVSRGTKCKQFLFSLSLNPPADAHVSTDDFKRAVDQAGEKLGLDSQPRAIVFHEKQGRDGIIRRHCHAVWSRIDASQMKAVEMSFHKRKLQDVSRELYLEHGWDMPKGHLDPLQRVPLNFSLAEWQQAKRTGTDPKVTKALIQSCWRQSDSKASFAHALKEHGYILAKGDRRGFVAVDYRGETHGISRSVGAKAKEVRARLGELDSLPSKDDAHAQAAALIAKRLETLRLQEEAKKQSELERLNAEAKAQAKRQEAERARLKAAQSERATREQSQREERLRKGVLGLLDRITGKRPRQVSENALAKTKADARDQQERSKLIAQHSEGTQALQEKKNQVVTRRDGIRTELYDDIVKLKSSADAGREQRKEEFLARRKAERPRRQRARNRDGPGLDH